MDRDFQEHTEQAGISPVITSLEHSMMHNKRVYLLYGASRLSEQIVLDNLPAGQAPVSRLTMWYQQARTDVIYTVPEPHLICFEIKCIDMVYSEGTVTFCTSVRPR